MQYFSKENYFKSGLFFVFFILFQNLQATCPSHDLLINSELSNIGFEKGISNQSELKITTYDQVNLKHLFDCKNAIANVNSLRQKMEISMELENVQKNDSKAIMRSYLDSQVNKQSKCSFCRDYCKTSIDMNAKKNKDVFVSSITNNDTNGLLTQKKFTNVINKVSTYELGQKKLILYYNNNKAVAYYAQDGKSGMNYLVDLESCPANTIHTTVVSKNKKSQTQKINCLDEKMIPNTICKKIIGLQHSNASLPVLVPKRIIYEKSSSATIQK